MILSQRLRLASESNDSLQTQRIPITSARSFSITDIDEIGIPLFKLWSIIQEAQQQQKDTDYIKSELIKNQSMLKLKLTCEKNITTFVAACFGQVSNLNILTPIGTKVYTKYQL